LIRFVRAGSLRRPPLAPRLAARVDVEVQPIAAIAEVNLNVQVGLLEPGHRLAVSSSVAPMPGWRSVSLRKAPASTSSIRR
jgi:hypothetical protein